MHAEVSKIRILLTRPVAAHHRSRIEAEIPEIEWLLDPTLATETVTQADVLYSRASTITTDLLHQATSLRLVQVAGVDAPPEIIRICDERSIPICTASTVFVPTVAEKVIGLLLAHSHCLLTESQDRSAKLSEQKVVILGVGRLGQAIARYCQAFGMEVVGLEHRHAAVPFVDHLLQTDELIEELAGTDWLVVSLPWTKQTEGLVDQTMFEALKPEASIVSVSHQNVLEPRSLQAALESPDRNVWIFSEPGGHATRHTHQQSGHGRLHLVPSVVVDSLVDTNDVVNLLLRNLHHLREGRPCENRIEI